ncbi:spore germination protein GerPE [Paenibacillus sp. H1-7]|uniref:spore germination protein GerPE n=1 Tax=Paenibacillus sp. H1-7 TaxID=2282849 RepID=UPI001EF9A634|nr:spore germination protein GerPE [Paenibacillus sp. H1-7]ULL17250.1 spore germination protein GerPE [Paenibacillus sp. H1-7]
MVRWSLVRFLKVNSVSQGSILQIGDNQTVQPEAKVLNVQREVAHDNGNEVDMDAYASYSREIPEVTIHEPVTMSVHNECDYIQVGIVRILSVSTSGVVQIGQNERIEAVSRVKRIRQMNTAVDKKQD